MAVEAAPACHCSVQLSTFLRMLRGTQTKIKYVGNFEIPATTVKSRTKHTVIGWPLKVAVL